MRYAFLIVLALFAFAGEARAAACTYGTDCYADCVKGPVVSPPGYKNEACAAKTPPVPVDPLVLLVEDFEAGTLYDARGSGPTGTTGPVNCDYANLNADTANCYHNNTAPFYGPWYDDQTSGPEQYRGTNSYWFRHYGQAAGCGEWVAPQTLGKNGTYSGGCAEWRADNAWDGNHTAIIDIVRNGEFDDERATLAEPTLPGGGAGVFDGRQSLAQRIQPIVGATSGFHGGKDFGHHVTHIGITQATAYPADIIGSGVWESPWKHDEQGWDGGGNYENLQTGNTSCGDACDEAGILPYSPFAFGSGAGFSACETARTNATISVGDSFCTPGGSLRVFPVAAQYVQSVNFPWGTWGCTRAEQKNKGAANMEWRIWHNEVLIFEMTNFDSTVLLMPYFTSYKWNNFANYNQVEFNPPGQHTAYTTYRYQDNIHVREGAPVSCEQLGFDFAPGVDGGDLALSASSYSVTEGTGGTAPNISVNVVRTGGTDGAVGATVSTVAGTATAGGVDYTGTSQTVSFDDGSSVCNECPILFAINPDAIDEGASEAFTVNLGSVTGGATPISPTTAQATITDDDDPPITSGISGGFTGGGP